MLACSAIVIAEHASMVQILDEILLPSGVTEYNAAQHSVQCALLCLQQLNTGGLMSHVILHAGVECLCMHLC
jgi:hypothetical protein